MDVKTKSHYAQFETDLPPLLAVEHTAKGWRGLTMDGMVLNVESANGHPIEIPFGSKIAVRRNGEHVGYRAVPAEPSPGLIDRYSKCFEMSSRAMRNNNTANARLAVETAMSFAPTLTTYYNRGMILLEQGRWQEGFNDYAYAIEYPGSAFVRSQYAACIEYGLTRWRGEYIEGKRLLLIHDHGFGDSIMMLRYVPMLKAMGARVVLWVPPELMTLAAQCAPVTCEPVSADYFCSLTFLLQVLHQTPDSIPLQPYLQVDQNLAHRWRCRLGVGEDKTNVVGVAWNAGNTGKGDFPRTMPLKLLAEALPGKRLISVQQQDGDEAVSCGVTPYTFEDFSDCAALMSCCDEVVTVDTAAVHLAGATGHPRVSLLLSHWHSWRWLSPLYANLHICTQDVAGDWDSALAKLGKG